MKPDAREVLFNVPLNSVKQFHGNPPNVPLPLCPTLLRLCDRVFNVKTIELGAKFMVSGD
jgi:hypothetical protein